MGLRLEATPTRDLPAKNWKKCSQLIKCYHFRWSLQKKTRKEIASNSTHACQIKWAEPWCQIHLDLFTFAKKTGKSRVLAKNRVFPGKTKFYLPLPDKTEVYSQTREISRVWRYRVHRKEAIVDHLYIYILYTQYIHVTIIIHIVMW